MDSLRNPPKHIQIYKRMSHRFPADHPIQKVILTHIKSMEAGYFGESYVDHFLKQILFPKSHAVIKGLHIQIRPGSFLQIDTLIITQKYIAILEIKNIKGRIHFQQNPNQLVRELNGETSTFKCPEQQILRHQKNLEFLMDQLNISIPLEKLIIFAFSSTHIAQPPLHVKVLMGCDISNYLDKLNELPDVVSTSTFKRFVKALTSRSIDFIPKPLAETYSLDWNAIQTGLLCPKCHFKCTTQTHCPSCNIPRKVLQIQAIEDWFYLCKDTISNKECVDFLQLKDKYAASYLLKTLKLSSINNNKSRHYTYSTSFCLIKNHYNKEY